MAVLTKQIREGDYYENSVKRPYKCRILAVATRAGGKLSCPVLDFFSQRAKEDYQSLVNLTALIESVARNGTPKNRTQFKKVEGSDAIFEFKEFQQRVLCFWDSDYTLICTNACVKKGDKLPRAVTKAAEAAKAAYMHAKKTNTLTHEP